MTNKQYEQIKIDFAKLAIQKIDDYKQLLCDSKNIKDKEFRDMSYAIYGCKLILQGIINEGETFEVKLG
jgi:hypothetical protein